jgi:hypothetical protein
MRVPKSYRDRSENEWETAMVRVEERESNRQAGSQLDSQPSERNGCRWSYGMYGERE